MMEEVELTSQRGQNVLENKNVFNTLRSTVPDMGDRLATIDMGLKRGWADVPLSVRESWVPI